jgi:hypothetical protein
MAITVDLGFRGGRPSCIDGRRVAGAVILVSLVLPSLAAGQDEPEAACLLAQAETAWIQTALDGWERVSAEILQLEPERLPWTVLFDKSCAWHLAPDMTRLSGAHPVSTGLTYAGEGVPVSVGYHVDGVLLPNGSAVPVEGVAFTSVYERESGVREPFFVLALMEVWRDRFPAAGPEFAARLEATFLGVAIHELVHTRQVVTVARRIDELKSRYVLPERLGDRMVEERYRGVPGYRQKHDEETDLLYRATSEADRERKQALVRQAMSLIRARQAEYFTGAHAVYRELEELFLNMEGAAVWASYKWSLLDPAHDIGIGDDPAASRARNTWAQDQGLALFLLIDELVPEWRSRVLGPELASPYGLLEEALLQDVVAVELALVMPGPATNLSAPQVCASALYFDQ